MRRKVLSMAIALIAIFILGSCQKNEPISTGEKKVASSNVLTPGNTLTFDLIAGQNIVAGYVELELYNPNTMLATYHATGDWRIEEVHFWIGEDPNGYPQTPNSGNPVLGAFPYFVDNLDGAHSVTLFPFDAAGWCGKTLWFIAHAALTNIVTLANETAYVGEDLGSSNWAMIQGFSVDCESPPTTCFQYETAWGEGSRYTPRGNWATYSYYLPNSTINLYAGQTNLAGTIHFSPVINGEVTITVNLVQDWEFAGDYHIEGYNTPPSGNPAPGLFTWKGGAAGDNLVITVNEKNIYGLHFEVKKEVPCP
jgi:hypothetical protein